MSNLEIEKFTEVTQELLIVIESLEKKIFEKPLPLEAVKKELETKNKILALIAKSDGIICGFKVGYELSNDVFYSWIGGVDPEFRRNGAASFLMTEQHKILKEMRYKYVRTSTKNKYREMLILNIKSGFDITGVQRKLKEADQSILLEKEL